jgi:hypothetical protein
MIYVCKQDIPSIYVIFVHVDGWDVLFTNINHIDGWDVLFTNINHVDGWDVLLRRGMSCLQT